MNNQIITVVIILVLVAGGFFLFKNRGMAPTGDEVNNSDTSTQGVQPDVTGGLDERIGDQPDATPSVKEFSVDGDNFSFSPARMTVNAGDTVKITLRNTDTMPHDLKIDALGVSTNVLNPGEFQTVTFVAKTAGTFEYYCSVGNHRAMGMVGTLTVR